MLSRFINIITPDRLFSGFTIARKMMIGYLLLVMLTVGIVAFVLVSLKQLNTINQEIVMVDIPVQEASGKMLDAIYAQDTYEKRYLILAADDMLNLFRKRAAEFNNLLRSLKKLPAAEQLPLKQIDKLHDQYNALFDREIRFVKQGAASSAAAISNGELKTKFDQMVTLLRSMSSGAKVSQESRMKSINEIGARAFVTTMVLCILGLALGVTSSMIVTRHISSQINKLRVATAQIAEGNFTYDPAIMTKDEIGSLAGAFVSMGRRLSKLEEMYLDASPLTRLPGGIAIENVLKQRIGSGKPIAFCVIDLDNFKSFNDAYGYAHGNVVLKGTAKIIETAVRAKGSSDDFVGHVGGDDFVVITRPEHMREVSSEIIKQFDEYIPGLYDEKDRTNGYIVGKNRQGETMQFPIMTISIAIVTNEHRTLRSPLEASEIAAELKDYAKGIPTSMYVVDKRRAK